MTIGEIRLNRCEIFKVNIVTTYSGQAPNLYTAILLSTGLIVVALNRYRPCITTEWWDQRIGEAHKRAAACYGMSFSEVNKSSCTHDFKR